MKRLLSVILVVTMILSMVSIVPVFAEEVATPTVTRGWFGSQLTDYQALIYDALVENADDLLSYNSASNMLTIAIPSDKVMSVDIDVTDLGTITTENASSILTTTPEYQEYYHEILDNQVGRACDAFYMDTMTETWWYSYGCGFASKYKQTGNTVTLWYSIIGIYVIPRYEDAAANKEAVTAGLEQSVNEIDALVTDDMTAYQKVKTVHDYIANKLTYFPYLSDPSKYAENMKIHTIDSCIIPTEDNGTSYYYSVCEGYTRYYRYLLQHIGFETVAVRGGQNRDAATGIVITDHMWIYIKMDDGKWYGSDVTWDDQTAGIFTDWFLCGNNTVAQYWTNYQTVRFIDSHIPDTIINDSPENPGTYTEFVYPELADNYYVNIMFSQDSYEMFANDTLDLKGLYTIESPFSQKSLTFTSSDTSVMSVLNNRYLEGVADGTADLTLTFNTNYSKTVPVRVYDGVISLTANNTSIITDVNTPVAITYTVVPENYITATDITWSSSNTSIATVNNSGIVTPKAPGNVTITGTYLNFTITCEVKVTSKITYIEIDNNTGASENDRETLLKYDTKQLTVTCNPLGYTEKCVWTSSDESVATVDQNGLITAVGGGDANITVASESGTVSDTYYLHVRVPMTGIELTCDDSLLLTDSTAKLIVNYLPADTNDDRTAVFSGNASECTVDKNGVVTPAAIENNTTREITVSATVGSFSDTYTFTVMNRVSDFKILNNGKEISSLTLVKGDKTTITNTPVYQNSYYGTLTWNSKNPAVATVDSNGVITAVEAGTTQIGIESSAGVSKYINVTVEIPLESIDVYSDDYVLKVGELASIDIDYIPANNTYVKPDTPIEVSGYDESILNIDEDGTIVAVGEGKTTVTITVLGKTDSFEIFVYNAPVIKLDKITDKSNTVSWAPASGAEYYELYRKQGTGDYEPLATISAEDFTGTYTDEAVSNEETYYYIYRIATTVQGDIEYNIYTEFSDYVMSSFKLEKPVISSAKATDNTSVKVTWKAVPYAEGYILSRSTDKKSFKNIAFITDGSTSYIDENLTLGMLYYYKVTAFNGSIQSEASDMVLGKTTLPAPTITSAASASYNSVIIKWNAMSDINGYYLYRSTSSGTLGERIATLTGDKVNYADTGLTCGVTYYYTLTSFKTFTENTVESEYSSVVSVKPIPNTPTVTSVKANNYNTVSVTWDAVSGATKYNVYYSTTSAKTGWTLADTVTGTSLTVSNLTCGATYYFTVKAIRDTIASKYNDGIAVLLKPTAPTVTAEATAYNSIKLTWNKIPEASGYYIYRDSSTTPIKTITSASTTTYTDTTVECGIEYKYYICAYVNYNDNIVTSSKSKDVTCTTSLNTPVITGAVSVAYNSIKLNWAKIPGATGYKVYRTTEQGSWSGTLIATVDGGSTVSYTDATAVCGTQYYYTLRAITTNSKGTVQSGFKSTGIACKAIPSAPKISTTEATSVTSIKLTWNQVSGVTGYRIYRSTSSTSGWSTVATVKNASTVTYTDVKAAPGIQYYYTIKAYRNQDGTNVWSGYELPGTAGKTKLSTPKISSATSVGYTSVKLSWSKITGANGYIIYRSKTKTGGWSKIAKVSGGSTVTYTDAKATYNTQYYYTMRAYVTLDGTDYTSSYVKTGVAGKAVATKPTFKATSSGYNSVKLTWTAVGQADGYIIYRTTNSDNTGWQTIKTITKGTTVSFKDTNLSCGTTYYYTMRSYKTINGKKVTSGYLKYGKACKPVPASCIVTAVQQKDKSVLIEWTTVSGATKYIVYRREVGGSWSALRTITNLNITYYTDKTANDSTQYEYTVRAYRNTVGGTYKAVSVTPYSE